MTIHQNELRDAPRTEDRVKRGDTWGGYWDAIKGALTAGMQKSTMTHGVHVSVGIPEWIKAERPNELVQEAIVHYKRIDVTMLYTKSIPTGPMAGEAKEGET